MEFVKKRGDPLLSGASLRTTAPARLPAVVVGDAADAKRRPLTAALKRQGGMPMMRKRRTAAYKVIANSEGGAVEARVGKGRKGEIQPLRAVRTLGVRRDVQRRRPRVCRLCSVGEPAAFSSC